MKDSSTTAAPLSLTRKELATRVRKILGQKLRDSKPSLNVVLEVRRTHMPTEPGEENIPALAVTVHHVGKVDEAAVNTLVAEACKEGGIALESMLFVDESAASTAVQ